MKDRMFFIIPFIWGKKVSVQERTFEARGL